jgi:hypothetical protein
MAIPLEDGLNHQFMLWLAMDDARLKLTIAFHRVRQTSVMVNDAFSASSRTRSPWVKLAGILYIRIRFKTLGKYLSHAFGIVKSVQYAVASLI